MQAINIDDLRTSAKRRLPRAIFEFIDGGAQDETTLRANQEDFRRWRFRTRTLIDVSTRDQSITLFGQRYASPLILAPTGLAGLFSRRGELAAARAAEKFGVPYCLSTMSTCTIEEITRETTPPKWFQLYVLRDRDLTRHFIERARASHCTALVLTVDTKVQGPRERDMRNGFTVPPRFSAATILDFAWHYSWLFDVGLGPRITFKNFIGSKAASTDAMTITQFIAGQYDLSVGWRDVEWFKSAWGGPVLLKGILTAEDARLALDHGADGVIVSNHGGRQLEGAMSAVQALPEIAEAVGDKLEVILDGGIRRGADVVRARALGAKACMIGRAWLYGLAAGGQPGVERALEILRNEIDVTLTLLGRPTLAEIDRGILQG
jgi:isopentenyl diphosphate isomerase/L-lactate dehydrogenase-like FMN-dependent dehydrogenase